MERLHLISAMAIVCCGLLFSVDVQAESQTEKYLGEREMCLDVVRIKESLVLDNQCIIFETYKGAFYLNRLPVLCNGLKISGGFSYEIRLDKLCKQDAITVLEPGSAPGGTCMIGEFVRFKQKGTLSDIRKLLEDGLLDDLIEEGAFEEAFPVKE
jgi:hypothetical protein